jgi:hypothetical protein
MKVCLKWPKTGSFALYWPLAHAKIECDWRPVAYKLCPSGRQSHVNCIREAASRMKISLDFIHVACDWRPRGYNLHATGGHSGTIYKPLAASRIQFLHAQAASTVQSRQFLKAHCQNNYLKKKK